MTEQLLPCPFCGGKADFSETNAWWVTCNECNAETDADMSPEGAAEYWNKRTPSPQTHVAGPQPCGIADPSTRDCPNMREVGGGMDGERYRCDVCGKGYFLDYEEMK